MQQENKKLNSLFLDIQTTKGMQVSSFRKMIEDTLKEIDSIPEELENETLNTTYGKAIADNIYLSISDIKGRIQKYIRTNNSIELSLNSNKKDIYKDRNRFKSLLSSENSNLQTMMEEFEKRFADKVKGYEEITDLDQENIMRTFRNVLADFSRSNRRVEGIVS